MTYSDDKRKIPRRCNNRIKRDVLSCLLEILSDQAMAPKRRRIDKKEVDSLGVYKIKYVEVVKGCRIERLIII